MVRTAFSAVEGVNDVGNVTLHDYGFCAKVGTVEIVSTLDDVPSLLARCEEAAAKLKEADGIDVQIVLKSGVPEGAPGE